MVKRYHVSIDTKTSRYRIWDNKEQKYIENGNLNFESYEDAWRWIKGYRDDGIVMTAKAIR